MLPVPCMINPLPREAHAVVFMLGRDFVPLKFTATVVSIWKHRFTLASTESIAGKQLRRGAGELIDAWSLDPSPGKSNLSNRLLLVHCGKAVAMWSGRGLQTLHSRCSDETGSKDFGSSLRGC
jgi:hypothetical protein